MKPRIGKVLFTKRFIPGYPIGLCAETRCVVREIRKRECRMRVERDDGREGSWWVNFDDMREACQ